MTLENKNFYIADKSVKLCLANVNPLQFFRQVKQEVKKVTWPSKKEVVQSLVMVIALVAITATFFFVVDQVLSWIVKLVFSIRE